MRRFNPQADSVIAIALLALLCLACGGCNRQAPANVFLNGDLAKGTGDAPEHWTSVAWDPGSVRFRWNHPKGGRAEMEISNVKPNDTSWNQTIYLAPGWYHFTADLRAENVPQNAAGVHLSSEGPITSTVVRGTTPWETVGLYLKISRPGAEVALGCRLGGFGSLNTGTGFCRDFRGTRVEAPPAGEGLQYDLALIRGPRPSLRASRLVNPITLTLLAVLAAIAIAFRRHGEVLLVEIAVAVFLCLFTYPILANPWGIGVAWDWSEFLQHTWFESYSITHFHQFPLWNPYACGGMPWLANPSSQVATPLFVLQLVFGPLLGLHLQILVHLAIGWIGGYLLARVLGMGILGGLACASIFAASSWFFLHLAAGAITFMPGAYLPWIALLAWLGAERGSVMPWIAAGLFVAIGFGEGSVYQCTQGLLLAGVIALFLAVVRRSLWPIWGMIILGLFSVGFAAVKLLPGYVLIQQFPRPVDYPEYNPVRILLTALFARNQYYDRSFEFPFFFEYGAYLSLIAVALAATGAVFSPRRASLWVIVGAFFFVLAIGDPGPWYPWSLHHRLPIFSQQRTPARLLIPFTLAIAVLAGLGADFLTRRLRPFGAIFASLLVCGAVFDAWLVSIPNLAAPVAGGLSPHRAPPQFKQFYGSTWDMFETSLYNRGAVACNEVLALYKSPYSVIGANQPGYFGEQYMTGPGSVTLREWTPNALSYDVNAPSAGVVVVNQNYDSNWRLAEGRGEVFSDGGLIGIRVPRGSEHLKLVYRSYPFMAGAAVTFLTCLAAILLWRRSAPGA